MTSSLFFSLNPPENFVPLDISSLVWCPWLHGSKTALPLANDIHDDVFVPPHDPSLLLAYSAHHKVKVINVGLVVELLQNHFSQDVQSEVSTSWSEKQLIDAIEGCTADSLYYAELSDHSDAITALSLSRDATCLGSASLDGKVCIYSLVSRMAGNMKYKLRPIHVFSPHGGLPLYALIFLDNVLHNDESITWSYLLTGAESNREIRLWSCYDWSCLQVIQFCSVIPSTDLLKSLNISLSKSSIILAVDQSASFLIATDVTRRVLYTLELAVVKDVLVSSDNERSLSSSSSSMLSVSKKICCFISIGEFLLTTPCLLFALGPSSRKAKTGVDPLSIKEKIGSHKVLMDQICLDIHIIHNRNLLNGTIRFDLPYRSESVLNFHSLLFSRVSNSISKHFSTTLLNIIEIKHTYVLDERDSSEILTSKQLGHDSLMPNTLENQLLMEKLTNLNSSNSHLSIKTEIEGNSSFNHNMETISPSQHEPPEAEKLQNVLSVTLLNMTNQSTEELVFESISKTADKTAISDFPPMNCVPSLCSTDTTTNKIPLNSSSPTRDNNGNNENLSNEAYTTTNHIDENDLIFLTTTTTTSSMSPPLELLPPSLPSQLSIDTVNETTEHDSHNNKNNKVNTNDDDNRRTHNEMNRILNHLEMLSINSEKQSKQFDYILDQLNETKLKLERLEQTQFDIIEQINNVNYQGSLIPSTQPSNIVTMTESNVNLEHWEIKSMELSNQIISQLRTVQGDSARRYAKISENMNKILSNIQDPNHSMKTNMLHNLESRVNALPTITSDCIRRVLHEELLRVFSNNLSRIVEPLQQSLFNVLKDHLSSLPTTLTDNVQRTLREKNFTTQIVRSASGILSTELSNAYRDSLNKIYVPALEKSTKKLFTDLNNVFQLGTQQYLNQISSRIQTPSFDATNFTPLMNQISSMIKSTLTETLKEVESKRGNSSSLKLNQSSDSYTTNTIDRNDHYSDVVFDNVKHKQSNSTMLDKTAVNKKSYNRHLNKSGIVNTPLVSGSNNNNNSNNNNPSVKNKIQTTNESPYSSNLLPQPPLSTLTTTTPTTSSSSLSSSMKQDKLTRLFRQAQVLIHSDRLVDALELALVSTDQPLLLDICNDIDVNKLFSSGDHTIGQNILLSLIHQLSCGDLSAQLDLKVK
uniref:Enhancer of mRNA-decapping protein 4 n=1 Tax=Schistosoma haematobium TaxID=6185 RepID=A0A094ZRY0_SCHHA